jgi:hypothetical protein
VSVDVFTELFVSSAMSNSPGPSVAPRLGVASDEVGVVAAGVALTGGVAVTGEASLVCTRCLGIS